jgi:hypothetical protein
MSFSSESTMWTEVSIYISKNGEWEHVEDNNIYMEEEG